VESLFDKFGDISRVKVGRSKSNRGYAFVTFEKSKYAEAALAGRKGYRIDGDEITLDYDAGLQK